MGDKVVGNITKYLEKCIKYFVYSVFAVVVFLVVFALVNDNTQNEANVGDFKVAQFNEGWSISVNGENRGIATLPHVVDCNKNDVIILRNILPEDITDGMNLAFRTSLQDVYIYVDGQLRESYSANNIKYVAYYLPSAYVFTSLTGIDAGKPVEMRITVKSKGVLYGVSLGHGNNAWYDVVGDNIALTVTTIFIIFLGGLVILFFAFLRSKLKTNNSVFFLGSLMVMMGIWMLSESKIRQLIFTRPSLSSIFSYLSVEVIGILAILYFDEVQYYRYHKIYLIIELILSGQLLVNIVLNVLGIAYFYNTLLFSHIELLVGIIIIAGNMVIDIRKGEIKNYKFVAIGTGLFLISSLVEMSIFYFLKYSTLGLYLCIGLIFLLFFTIIQILYDTTNRYQLNEKRQRESIINTIETIASTIDAKDEYTGGHSNRVGEYAGILARAMAEDYGFSEDDIIRIRYIGLMHDIGKIGVADTILNKTGRLTDEEFTLMKKHIEIGSVLLEAMDEEIEGLIAGIKYHHERYDGNGYPSGLSREEIPLIARILCLADCYDAMTSNRVYRKRLSDEEVRNEILRCSGTQFDPALTEIFVKLLDSGVIKPTTIGGLEANEKGVIRKSSLLEERLQKDIALGQEQILNPAHVRMVCYIMKLAEYSKQNFDMFFVEASQQAINEVMKKYIKNKDINIQYTDNQNLVVLFEYSDAEIEQIRNAIAEHIQDVKVINM